MDIKCNNRNENFYLKNNQGIKAKDIRIFIEDGQPYVYYVGEFTDGKNQFEITFPKMSMNITAITNDVIDLCDCEPFFPTVAFARNIYVTQEDECFYVTCKEKEMTKEEIENVLGYKIRIKDEDED